MVALVDAPRGSSRSLRSGTAPRRRRPRAARAPRSPRPAKTRSIGGVARASPRRRSARSRLAGERGELLEQARADAVSLQLVGDGERDLGGARVAQPHVVRERDDPSSSVTPISAPRSSKSGSTNGSDARRRPTTGRGTGCTGSAPTAPRRTRMARRRPRASAAAAAASRPSRRMTSTSAKAPGAARVTRASPVSL